MFRRLLVSALMLMSVAASTASELLVERSTANGYWGTYLFRDSESGVRQCSIESAVGDTVFRLSEYFNDTRDVYVDVYNPGWSLQEGATAAIRFDFAAPGDVAFQSNWSVEVVSDGYAIPITLADESRYNLLQVLLGDSTTMTVIAPDGSAIAQFSLKGSAKALKDYTACLLGEDF